MFSRLQNDVTIQTQRKELSPASYANDVVRPFTDQSSVFWGSKFSSFPFNYSTYRTSLLNNPNIPSVPFNPIPFLPTPNLIPNSFLPSSFEAHSPRIDVRENTMPSPGNSTSNSEEDPQENDVTTTEQNKDDLCKNDMMNQYEC